MSLPDGYTDLPPGKLAAVVTFLEMCDFPAGLQPKAPAGLKVRRVEHPDPAWYRELFRKVGSPWLWFSRLRLSDAELVAVTHHPLIEVYVLEQDGDEAGLMELDFRQPAEVELAYLGIIPDCIGLGAGRFLIETAIARAAQQEMKRFWLHTCSLDHPGALGFYQRMGFQPYKRAIEVMDDPRLTGDLSRDAAPHIPLLPFH
jgi:GNAT superfamily N-acetyltransferase